MRIRNKTFAGGYRFRGFAGRPRQRILDNRIPEQAALPLSSGGSEEIEPLVASGDAVTAGQILARNDEKIGSPVLSPVNGVVEGLSSVTTPQGPARALVVRSDGSRGCQPLEGATPNWQDLGPGELEELLYLCGATALSPQGIPTRFRSSALTPQQVAHIVVLEARDELFNPSLETILADREPDGVEKNKESTPETTPQGSEEAAQGLAILARIMPRAKLHLAFSRTLKDALCCLGRACSEAKLEQVDLVALDPKYPVHHEKVLLPTALDLDVPPGGSAADHGVVILDLQSLLQVYDAVTRGKPVLERIVVLGGSGFARPLHVRTRLGTPVGEIVAEYLDRAVEERLVLNSALSGPLLSDLATPLEASFTCILALPEEEEGPLLAFAQPGFRRDSYTRTFASMLAPFFKTADTNLHGERRPCIACGYCEEVCPARILPYLLHRHLEKKAIDENLVRFRIFDCIDCGLCSYVCTSKIPLAEQIREGKEKLRAEGLEPEPVSAPAQGAEL